MNRSRWAAAMVSIVLVAGCNRPAPRFVPAASDSTAGAGADSFAVLVASALERWESQPGDEVAATTEALILGDLRRHPDQGVADRARTMIDSCGFSGEVVGGATVAAVNLFARSDPSGGAWPSLFWRDGANVRMQEVDGSGMRLVDLAVKPSSASGGGEGGGQAAMLFTQTGRRGQQPVVLVWRRPANAPQWTLAQTLGPDSLGGTGTARFLPAPDAAQLETQTWRGNAGFDECATCPHVIHTRRFAWTNDGFAQRGETVTASPYATFVQLIAALRAGDQELAVRRLADPSLLEAAQRYDWGRTTGLWRAAPGAEENTSEMVFFRGNKEAYRVRFSQRGADWVVSDLQPVDRSIE